MKKILAILLALALVLVNVAVLADEIVEDVIEEEETVIDEAANEGESGDENILDNQDPSLAQVYDNKDDTSDPNNGKLIGYTAPTSIKLVKAYKVTGVTAVMPEHKLNFIVKEVEVTDNNNKTFPAGKVTVSEITVPAETADGAELDMVVNLPTYTEPGVYHYTIEENDGTTDNEGNALTNPHTVAGVQYVTKTYEFKVTVIEGAALQAGGITASGLVIGAVALREEGATGKIDTIENEYIAGSLKVEKKVTGNMGDRKLPFDFTVKFESVDGNYVDAPITYTETIYDDLGNVTDTVDKYIELGWNTSKEVTFRLIHDGSITFENIPESVKYTVTETDNGLGYTTTDTDNKSEKIEDESEHDVIFTNDKTSTIDTGIELETLPFVLLMGIALAGAVLSIRRREDY